MKKTVALFAGFLLVSPFFAAADTLADMQTQLRFTLARASALTADDPIQCFLAASLQRVKVGEPFTLVWFSTGANTQVAHAGVQQQPYGVQTIALDHAGKWTYTFAYYDSSGADVSCSVSIIATK